MEQLYQNMIGVGKCVACQKIDGLFMGLTELGESEHYAMNSYCFECLPILGRIEN